MSRTRIVKGKYTKIIGEDYNVSAEGNISYNAINEVRDNGIDNGVFYGNFEKLGSDVSDDFEIRFSLKKDKSYSTFVPFGIVDFEGNNENANFVFDYSLMLGNIDSLEFKILNEDGSTLYAITNLPEVVVTARRLPLLAEDLVKQKPKYNPLQPIRTWDWKSIFDPYNISSSDYTKVGSYVIFWDGFDNNDIYDSSKFNNKKLKAVIKAMKNGKEKIAEVEFSTKYGQVNWVDVKIDKKNKKIETTLRVNLKDGGAEGLTLGNDVPLNLQTHGAPISVQTRSFVDLEKLALDGLKYHWGRNQNHVAAKNVNINSEPYEVFVNGVNTEENSMDDMHLIYNTNRKWMRSGNPGSATLNPISWIGNLISREAVCYNVGYIKYSNGWNFESGSNEDINFKETAAHEIGHEILKSYGGTVYSYGHKGSVNVVTQNNSDQSINYPTTGEIDIMPYYNNYIPINDRVKMVAAEKDVLSLIWLSKLIIK